MECRRKNSNGEKNLIISSEKDKKGNVEKANPMQIVHKLVIQILYEKIICHVIAN